MRFAHETRPWLTAIDLPIDIWMVGSVLLWGTHEPEVKIKFSVDYQDREHLLSVKSKISSSWRGWPETLLPVEVGADEGKVGEGFLTPFGLGQDLKELRSDIFSQLTLNDKVSRCLARYSPRVTTTNQPTNRAPNEPAGPGPK